MKRREALQLIMAAGASSIFVISCKEANVVDLFTDGRIRLDNTHTTYLNALSEIILPTAGVSDTLSEPSVFVMRMMNDCHSDEDKRKFVIGFDEFKRVINEKGLRISEELAPATIDLIKQSYQGEDMDENLLFFLQKTKDLSIQHLKSSEYYLTEVGDYQLIPIDYQACIDA